MGMTNNIRAASSLVGARAFGKRLPLAVSWAVTGRCNLRCAYCEIWAKKFNELTTAEALKVADEMGKARATRVSLTGGEPLLRVDIGQLIARLQKSDIIVSMNSNGLLVKQRLNDILELDHLSLSIDGPEGVHDALRGNGMHKKVMEAALEASGAGIETSFLAVMTHRNLPYLGELLDDTQCMGVKVLFQPVEAYEHSSKVAASLRPTKEELRRFFRSIPKKAIMNSSVCIREFVNPSIKPSNCAGGRLICRIAPDGFMFPCGRANNIGKAPDVRDGFLRGFMSLGVPSCNGCFCAGNVEASLLFRFNLHAIKKAAFP